MKPAGLLVLLCGALGAQTSWELLIAEGTQALENGSYLQAERSFEMALPAAENRSQEATTLVRLGLVQERQEQWARAEGYYFRAVSVGDEATALEHLTRVLRKAGRQTEADEKQARAFAIRAARIAAASPPRRRRTRSRYARRTRPPNSFTGRIRNTAQRLNWCDMGALWS